MALRKAKKSKSYPRIFIEGKTGSGKSASALRIATGIQDYLLTEADKNVDIAVIDTEYRRTEQYQGKNSWAEREYEFYIDDMYDDDMVASIDNIPVIDKLSAGNIISKIRQIKKTSNIKILIIDSISKSWDRIIDRASDIEIEGDRRYNSFSKWRHPETKPLWQKMIDEIMSFDGAVICTIRKKMKHEMKKVGDETRVVKIGVEAITQSETDYEATICLDSTNETIGEFIVSKDNSGMGLHEQVFQNPDEQLGYKIMEYIFANSTDGDAYVPRMYESKGLTEIKSKIEQNLDKIKTIPELKSAFETYIGIDTYAISTDEELLKTAYANVVKAYKKVKETSNAGK